MCQRQRQRRRPRGLGAAVGVDRAWVPTTVLTPSPLLDEAERQWASKLLAAAHWSSQGRSSSVLKLQVTVGSAAGGADSVEGTSRLLEGAPTAATTATAAGAGAGAGAAAAGAAALPYKRHRKRERKRQQRQ